MKNKIFTLLVLVFSISILGALLAYCSTGDTQISFGDSDSDGALTAKDASVVLNKVLDNSYTMPIENKTDNYLYYIDVDMDGVLTSADAACILQKVLDSYYTMPCEINNNNNSSKILTVYFSCTGTTEQIAQYISAETNSDIYKIIPEIP